MKKKILIAAFACLSAMAMAQSSNNDAASASKETKPRDVATGQASGKTASQPGQVTAPRDLATGQASGKRQYAPVIIRKVTDDDPAAAQTNNPPQNNGGQANRESSAPSVSEIVVTKATDKAVPQVSKGDVNGDGKADAAINNSHSNIKNSKDVATGQASGKRQHEPITIKKELDPASPSK